MTQSKKSPGLSTVVSGGDLRQSLEATRNLLAARIDAAEIKDTAPLVRQLVIVLERLAALPGGQEVTRLDRIADELAGRRAVRRTAAASP